LISVEYRLHDIGREEREADDAADVSLGHAFVFCDRGD
jgi:hypothetical protein